MLDMLSGNRLLLMDKGNRLDTRDVDANLCVMLLMPHSANHEVKETLRLFKDRGDLRGFFPDEGDQDRRLRLAGVPKWRDWRNWSGRWSA